MDALTDPRWAHPSDVGPTSALMGAHDHELARLLPPWDEIPAALRRPDAPWVALVSEWFADGLAGRGALLVARAGVDRGRAIRHISAVLRSWAPGHEHKLAGAALLASRWFEPLPLPPADGGSP